MTIGNFCRHMKIHEGTSPMEKFKSSYKIIRGDKFHRRMNSHERKTQTSTKTKKNVTRTKRGTEVLAESSCNTHIESKSQQRPKYREQQQEEQPKRQEDQSNQGLIVEILKEKSRK